ncbi:MAG: TatD family hydrolase [Anaerovoracaceae bacterium]|jgi:TatD DNase family protein|nr:TatD family hydrolase [Anaerovoracaceae bacterium]
MLFDSHAHLNNESYKDGQREKLFRDIEASNLSYVMDVGFDLASSALALKHAQRFPWCYAVVGCHPHDAKDFDEDQLQLIKALAEKPEAKAIGEIGLDYYRNISSPEDQIHWFRRQIQLANLLKMPIVIHDRDAHGEVLDILKEEGAFSSERKSWFSQRPGSLGNEDARVLLHCYSGSKDQALQYVKLGATISIAGPVTYSNARKLIEVVEEVPLEYLLIETDSPYLTPVPFRGRPNTSLNVEYVAKKLAEIKGISFEEVARKTLENGIRFFDIKA